MTDLAELQDKAVDTLLLPEELDALLRSSLPICTKHLFVDKTLSHKWSTAHLEVIFNFLKPLSRVEKTPVVYYCNVDYELLGDALEGHPSRDNIISEFLCVDERVRLASSTPEQAQLYQSFFERNASRQDWLSMFIAGLRYDYMPAVELAMMHAAFSIKWDRGCMLALYDALKAGRFAAYTLAANQIMHVSMISDAFYEIMASYVDQSRSLGALLVGLGKLAPVVGYAPNEMYAGFVDEVLKVESIRAVFFIIDHFLLHGTPDQIKCLAEKVVSHERILSNLDVDISPARRLLLIEVEKRVSGGFDKNINKAWRQLFKLNFDQDVSQYSYFPFKQCILKCMVFAPKAVKAFLVFARSFDQHRAVLDFFSFCAKNSFNGSFLPKFAVRDYFRRVPYQLKAQYFRLSYMRKWVRQFDICVQVPAVVAFHQLESCESRCSNTTAVQRPRNVL